MTRILVIVLALAAGFAAPSARAEIGRAHV